MARLTVQRASGAVASHARKIDAPRPRRNGGACLIQIDTVNNTIVNQNINIPGCQTVVGVSIDIEGFVWVVDQGGRAYKVNPDTLATQTVMGFASPYTYSDMTGAGIRLQALPQ